MATLGDPPKVETAASAASEEKARAEDDRRRKAEEEQKKRADDEQRRRRDEEKVKAEPAKAASQVKIRSKPLCPFTFDGAAHGADWYTGSVAPGAYTVSFNCGDGRMKDVTVVAKPGETTETCWDFNLNGPCLR